MYHFRTCINVDSLDVLNVNHKERNDLIDFVRIDDMLIMMVIIDEMMMEFHFVFVNYSYLVRDDREIKIDVCLLHVVVDFLIQYYSIVHIEFVYLSK
jgi:hypothetical protein